MADVPTTVTAKEETGGDNLALLRQIREQFGKDLDCERANWEAAADDLRYLALDQWPSKEKSDRDGENRPCLTFDLLGEKMNQITGDMRMNKPAIKVRPAEDSDVDMSDFFSGIIRHIEYASDASTAYTTAGMSAARCGYGNFRIVTQYTNDESFEQEIRIQRMPKPFAVIWDANATELTREDANHCYVLSRMTKAAFEAQYPGASLDEFDTTTPERSAWVKDWYHGDMITVAEYWVKEPAKKTIALMPGGKSEDVTGKSPTEIAAMGPVLDAAGNPRVREVKTHKVVQYIVNGAEILEGPTPWAGKDIPIIPVWGEEIETGENPVRMGAIRRAKDQQRIANFTISAAVETMAMSPKAPFVGTLEQFTGVEKYWKEANTMNWPFLPYVHDPKSPGPPQRQQPPTLNIAALELFRMSAEGVKAGMGMHDASVGARSNETSGKAILARQREGDVGSYTYTDNLTKAVAYGGRQLVDLIPKIYDTERSIRILGEDESQKFIKVNTRFDDKGRPMPEGKLFNDLSIGTYDVVVETGPSYSTKRQEAAETTLQLAQALPQIGIMAPDLLVRSMDIPLASEMADRLKKALPPGLAEPEEGEEEVPPPPPPPTPEQIAAAEKEAAVAAEQAKAQMDFENKKALQEQKHLQDLAAIDAKTIAEVDKALIEAEVSGDDADPELERLKLALEARKLDLEARKLDIEEARIQLEADLKREAMESSERMSGEDRAAKLSTADADRDAKLTTADQDREAKGDIAKQTLKAKAKTEAKPAGKQGAKS